MGNNDWIGGNPSIKFVLIGDDTYAVHYGKLMNSFDDLLQCQFSDLTLTEDHINS